MKTIHLRNESTYQTVADIHFILTRDKGIVVIFIERFSGKAIEINSKDINYIS